MSIDYDKIRRLISLMEENRLTELTVEEDGLSITIKAEQEGHAQTVQPTFGTQPPAEAHAPEVVEIEPVIVEPAKPQPPSEHLFEIKSPMIGVFYHRPSPDAPPYVSEGDDVEVGQTVGLMEAMKVFSEVPSEVAGRVVSIPVENGKLVQTGEVLVVIDTSGSA